MYQENVSADLFKNYVYKSCCNISSLDSFTWDLYEFFLKGWGWGGLYLHIHIFSIVVLVLLRGLELYVQMLSCLNYQTKNIPFVTICVYGNYLYCPPTCVRHVGARYIQYPVLWVCVLLGGTEIAISLYLLDIDFCTSTY